MIFSINFDCTLTLAIWGLQSRTTFFTEFLSLFSRSSRKFIASTELETYKQEIKDEDPYFTKKYYEKTSHSTRLNDKYIYLSNSVYLKLKWSTARENILWYIFVNSL